MNTKICIKCKEEKILECFGKNSNCKDGLRTDCKDCHNRHIREHRKKPEVRQKIRERERRPENKEKQKKRNQKPDVIKKRKEYNRINNQRPEVKESKRKYDQRPEIVERRKIKTRERSKTTKEKERKKKWQRENPEKVSAKNNNRRARLEEIPGFFIAQDIKNIFLIQEGKCYFCKNMFIPTKRCIKGYHIEHKIPISRKELNPTNWPENICLSCPNCNLRKYNKTDEEFFDILSKEE